MNEDTLMGWVTRIKRQKNLGWERLAKEIGISKHTLLKYYFRNEIPKRIKEKIIKWFERNNVMVSQRGDTILDINDVGAVPYDVVRERIKKKVVGLKGKPITIKTFTDKIEGTVIEVYEHHFVINTKYNFRQSISFSEVYVDGLVLEGEDEVSEVFTQC